MVSTICMRRACPPDDKWRSSYVVFGRPEPWLLERFKDLNGESLERSRRTVTEQDFHPLAARALEGPNEPRAVGRRKHWPTRSRGRFEVARYLDLLRDAGFASATSLHHFEHEIEQPTAAQNYACPVARNSLCPCHERRRSLANADLHIGSAIRLGSKPIKSGDVSFPPDSRHLRQFSGSSASGPPSRTLAWDATGGQQHRQRERPSVALLTGRGVVVDRRRRPSWPRSCLLFRFSTDRCTVGTIAQPPDVVTCFGPLLAIAIPAVLGVSARAERSVAWC
jgi:hypothetical protein